MNKLLPALMQLQTAIDLRLKEDEDFPTKNKDKVSGIFRDISELFGALFSAAEAEGRPCLRSCLGHLQVSLKVEEATGVVSVVYWQVLRRCRKAVRCLNVADLTSPQQKVGDVLGSVYVEVEAAMKIRGYFSPEADVFLPPEGQDRGTAYRDSVNDFFGFLPPSQAQKFQREWEQLQKDCFVEAPAMDVLISQRQKLCSLFARIVVGKLKPKPSIQSSPILNMKPELVKDVLQEAVSSRKAGLISDLLRTLPIYILTGEELFNIMKKAIRKCPASFPLLISCPSFAHMDRAYMDALLKSTIDPTVTEKLKETPGYKRKSPRIKS